MPCFLSPSRGSPEGEGGVESVLKRKSPHCRLVLSFCSRHPLSITLLRLPLAQVSKEGNLTIGHSLILKNRFTPRRIRSHSNSYSFSFFFAAFKKLSLKPPPRELSFLGTSSFFLNSLLKGFSASFLKGGLSPDFF